MRNVSKPIEPSPTIIPNTNRRNWRVKHGHYRTQTYKSWVGMKQRCENQNDEHYPSYGGRGIEVCEQWKRFENFLEDMGTRPEGATLDRIDPNGDYKPGNCRWATAKEQANNRRNTPFLSCDGKTQTLLEWAKEMGVKPNLIRGRLYRGWSVESAIKAPKYTCEACVDGVSTTPDRKCGKCGRFLRRLDEAAEEVLRGGA